MERQPKSGEQLPSIDTTELEQRPRSAEQSQEALERPEQRQERLETAREAVQKQPERASTPTEREAAPTNPVTRLDRAMNYKHTIKSLQRQLSPASRTFSKMIHAPVIEKASEVTARTVFRPSVTLGASLVALLVGGITFFTAKNYGFALSGSEFLLSLLVGGVIGVGLEGVGKLLRRRHR